MTDTSAAKDKPLAALDRSRSVVKLWRDGRKTADIAKVTGLSRSRVNQILKEEVAAESKKAGTSQIRWELLADLEVLKTEVRDRAMDGDKDAITAFIRAIKLQGDLAGPHPHSLPVLRGINA